MTKLFAYCPKCDITTELDVVNFLGKGNGAIDMKCIKGHNFIMRL